MGVGACDRHQSWKRPLTSDIQLQHLEFALLGFSLALVQYFLALSPNSSLIEWYYILCHYMLESI